MKEFITAVRKVESLLFKIIAAFWIAETICFLFAEGWHFKASSAAEKYCDSLVSKWLHVWVYLFIALLLIQIANIIHKIIQYTKL